MIRKLTRPRTIALVTLLALVGLTTWPAAEAQFGGGGFGGGGGGFVGGGFVGIMIEPSQSGKTLYGYSETTGSWDKLTAEPHPEDGLNATQTVGLAALRGKDHIHAFGAQSGKWASTKTDGEPTPIIISAGVAGCVAGNHLYAIGSNQEKWAVLDLGDNAARDIMTVHVSRIVYRTPTHVHVFSNASGKWASVDLTKD